MDPGGIHPADLVFRLVHSPHDALLGHVVDALASDRGRAAAALADARTRSARSAQDHARLAAEVLYAAYEAYQARASRPAQFLETPAGRDTGYKEVERPPDDRQNAQFYAGLAALALARVYRTLGLPEWQVTWLERSRDPFLAAYRMFPRLAESRMTVTASFVRRAPTRADLTDYRRRCDELLNAYRAAYASLAF